MFQRLFVASGLMWLVSIVLIFVAFRQNNETLLTIGVSFGVFSSMGLCIIMIWQTCCPNFIAESPQSIV